MISNYLFGYLDHKNRFLEQEPPLDLAKRIVDNRLRAMRSWLERNAPDATRKVDWLQMNLIETLERLAAETDNNRRYRPEAVLIGQLIAALKNITERDWPLFEAMYAKIGKKVPRSVRGQYW